MPKDSRREKSRKYDSSDSSDSEYSQKSSRRKKCDRGKRSRSHSRDKSYRYRHRSSSRSKKKFRRSVSRSPPRRYPSRGRSSSRDRERSSKRKYSRSSSRDRSRSKDRNEYSRSTNRKYKSKHESKRKSSSRSPSLTNRDGLLTLEASKKYIIDDTVSKVEKAIKAAEAAGLKMCKLPTPEYKEVKIKEDMPTIHDRNVLDDLNNEGFTQKQFTSSRSRKLPENIVIDLEAGSIKVPEIEIPKAESVFHPDFFPDEKTRMERWVKKLYIFRQKALRGDI